MPLHPPTIRSAFSIFSGTDAPLYFDSAATAQTPCVVLDAMDEYYQMYCANVHRGMHALTERATAAYEEARKTVARWINASFAREIVFTKNCTEAINLVARTWGDENVQKGDTIAVSLLEHHSNIVPWHQLATRKGAHVQWIEIDDDGRLRMDTLDAALGGGTVKIVAVTGQSNVLGTRPDLKAIARKAHDAGALVLVDAAQLIGHHPVDVQDLGCDFLAFSGHKLYGPTGVGVLYGRKELLEEMPPFLGGGMMIHAVRKDGFSPADLPQKFEAGTPPIAEAIGLAAAIDWFGEFRWEDKEAHETDLLREAYAVLGSIDGLTIFGPKSANERSGCISFVTEGAHPHDLTDILGQKNIALRAGHHCTQPLHERLRAKATTRLSVGIYNTREELVTLERELKEALNLLRN